MIRRAPSETIDVLNFFFMGSIHERQSTAMRDK